MTSSSQIDQLRAAALWSFQQGVKAADPEAALTEGFKQHPLPKLPQSSGEEGEYIVLAVGKAACRMAKCAIAHLPEDAKFRAIAVTNHENVKDIDQLEVLGASHPVPCAMGMAASARIIETLLRARRQDQVIMLISGGASALLPAPIEGVGLDDKIKLNQLLLAHGFDIYETNLIRQSVSSLKGGKALGLAAPASVTSYVLSDVIGDDLRVVGSGISVGGIGSPAEAKTLLQSRGVFGHLPASIRQYLDRPSDETLSPKNIDAHIIAGNRVSVAAMANAHMKLQPNSKPDASSTEQAIEITPAIIDVPLIGDVEAAVDIILQAIKANWQHQPFALAFGGETTVTLDPKASGMGGRNQELALRVALAMDDILKSTNSERPWCFLSGGTDGRDGPTNAAGGIVDSGTISRLNAAKVDVQAMLATHDSYNALKQSDDLIIIGATGTNVADLQLMILG